MNIELIASWTDAIESCENCEAALEAAVAKHDAAIQHGILSSNTALNLAMENLIQVHDRFILTMSMQLKEALEANAGNPPAAEAALSGPVGADMSEEHNTITPEETREGE